MIRKLAQKTFAAALAGTVLWAGLAYGQNDNPFMDPTADSSDASASPFSSTEGDPFATRALGETTSDPFSSPAAPPAQPNTQGDPFGSPAPSSTQGDPFASPGTQGDPFASPAPSGTQGDPFGSPAPGSTQGDPFASPAPSGTQGDPFASPAPSAAQSDPFGSSAPGASQGDPFASPGAATVSSQAGDPFGAATASSDPFGGTAGTSSDPFGASATSDDPFASGATTTDPFGGGLATASQGDPFGGGSGGVEIINPEGVRQLYIYRYEKVIKVDGGGVREVVQRRQLTREEADRYDEARQNELAQQALAGELENYDGTTDPLLWGEWCRYAEQLSLWSEYVDQVALAGKNPGESAYMMIQWPGAPREEQQGGQQSENLVNYASSTSLDDQTNELLNPFAGAGGQGEAPGRFPVETMINQIVDAYDTIDGRLREIEDEQLSYVRGLLARAQERREQRIAYVDWRNNQEELIEEFVLDWDRRYNGNVTVIGGVRYELYRPGNVPNSLHKDARVIVTDYELTPYDILNPEDGTIKQATRN